MLIACVLAIGVSACGSSSSPTTTSSAAAGTGGSATSGSAIYQARLNLAKCLRAHGVNVPDPSLNGGVAAGHGGGILQQVQSSPNYQSAIQACAKYRQQASPLANQSAAQRAQFQQALVKFAKCMRSHNINFPDPTGGEQSLHQQIPSSELNSPAFQSAANACKTDLPAQPGH
jgi:hypothetical protein